MAILHFHFKANTKSSKQSAECYSSYEFNLIHDETHSNLIVATPYKCDIIKTAFNMMIGDLGGRIIPDRYYTADFTNPIPPVEKLYAGCTISDSSYHLTLLSSFDEDFNGTKQLVNIEQFTSSKYNGKKKINFEDNTPMISIKNDREGLVDSLPTNASLISELLKRDEDAYSYWNKYAIMEIRKDNEKIKDTLHLLLLGLDAFSKVKHPAAQDMYKELKNLLDSDKTDKNSEDWANSALIVLTNNYLLEQYPEFYGWGIKENQMIPVYLRAISDLTNKTLICFDYTDILRTQFFEIEKYLGNNFIIFTGTNTVKDTLIGK